MAGIGTYFALSFALLAFSTFVYDTLDVCTRLARYILQELFGWKSFAGAFGATAITLSLPLAFLLLTKEKGYLVAWPVFGISNQLLASLTLLAVSIWLMRTGRKALFTILPMFFMLVFTLWALVLQIKPFVGALPVFGGRGRADARRDDLGGVRRDPSRAEHLAHDRGGPGALGRAHGSAEREQGAAERTVTNTPRGDRTGAGKRGTGFVNPPLDIKSLTGLSESAAAERLRDEGYNEIPSTRRRSIFAIAVEVVREPMFLMLVACGVLYLFLGDLQEALMLLFFVFVVMGITLYQERKTERALEALRDLSSPRALVIRDGVEKRIAGRDVVRGDLLVVKEGDRVPADAALLSSLNLSVDESLLTGESVPVRKMASGADGAWAASDPGAAGRPDADREPGDRAAAKDPAITKPGGDDLPFIYSSTLVVQGQGIAEVQAIGMGTEIGKIGKALRTVEPEETLLQKETGRLVRRLAIAGLTLCALVVVIYGLTRGDWLHGFLAGITLAMATLPEEFPVVLTIFLALGAWRISQSQVLTRRVPAVETLGSATVLCVDKTGTLTQNRMTVASFLLRRVPRHGERVRAHLVMTRPAPRARHRRRAPLKRRSPRASTSSSSSGSSRARSIPSIRWKRRSASSATGTSRRPNTCTATGRSFTSTRSRRSFSRSRACGRLPTGRTSSSRQRARPRRSSISATSTPPPSQRSIRTSPPSPTGAYASSVWPRRVSSTPLSHANSTTSRSSSSDSSGSPTRSARRCRAAIEECYAAGIRVVMITGDYPGTARNIARQVGLYPARQGHHRTRARQLSRTRRSGSASRT